MERIICVAIGYLFGLLQTGYLYGKTQHVDIRKEGSGNAGTTNALRTMGWKAGAITFLGDCFKCVLAVAATYFIYGKTQAEIWPLLMMYTGAGVILGHNFPFYMKFKGGKGIAATAGLIISTLSLPMVLVCLVAFVGIVGVTRYVSIGSLAIVVIYLVEIIICGQTGRFQMEPAYLYEMYAVAACLMLLAFYKHKANIKRLLNGTENKLSVGKHKNEK